MKKIAFLLLFLSGCGFTPLYSHSSPTYRALENTKIDIKKIPNQYGAKMYALLKEQLPAISQNPKKEYLLIVQAPHFTGYDKTITNDEFASTIQATATTAYTLKDLFTNKILLNKTTSATSSYMVETSPYATTVAKEKVYQELSGQLSQQIGQDILAFITQDNPS